MPAHPTATRAIETPPEGAELLDNLSALFSNPPGFSLEKQPEMGIQWLVPDLCEAKARGLLRDQGKPELFSNISG